MTKQTLSLFLAVASVLFFAPALLASAPPGRYAISPLTVKDNRTGLIWQRSATKFAYSQADAVDYCAKLKILDQSGWRLPTKHELETLVDIRVAAPGPTIDPVAFPNTPGKPFWTSTKSMTVNFGIGSTLYEAPCHIRCVRQ
ncbi:MAG TPA: DUF1566 domain-containing protein [Myxococcales bacterium]|jgi:hypothetical protein